METFKNYRYQSRVKQWGRETQDELSLEEINCGSLLRIADAMEKTAERINSLISENIRLKHENATLVRSRRAMMAINRKLKKQIQQSE